MGLRIALAFSQRHISVHGAGTGSKVEKREMGV